MFFSKDIVDLINIFFVVARNTSQLNVLNLFYQYFHFEGGGCGYSSTCGNYSNILTVATDLIS
jgi:hypothetical protein